MKRINLFWVSVISIVIMLIAYLLVSMTDPSIPDQETAPAQNTVTPAPTETPKPSTLTEYQSCLDRAKDSRAPQEFIDEDIRECERLYRP
jgi:hypothetical protein